MRMLLRKSLIAGALLFGLLLPSFLPVTGERVSVWEIFSLEVPEAVAQQPPAGASDVENNAQKFFAGVLQVLVVVNWIALSGVQALLSPDVIFGALTSAGVRPMEE